MYVNQVMRDRKLDVLAVQETHLSPSRLTALLDVFGTSLSIFHSDDPDNPSGARGIAFVVNKKRLAGRECRATTLVPGRALLLEYPWTPTRTVTMLAVYAPNQPSENGAFWRKLTQQWQDNVFVKPDFLLGDFNVVESALDRMPARADPPHATEPLVEMIVHFGLVDSWRASHPDEKLYTYRQAGMVRQSRLDRIYAKKRVLPMFADWESLPPGPLSDHDLVMASVANYDAPDLGRGRWSAPVALLSDTKFVAIMKDMSLALQARSEEIPEGSVEIQGLFADFKKRFVESARQRTKEWMPKLDRRIHALKQQLHTALNCGQPNIPEQEAQLTVAMLQERLQAAEAKRFSTRQRKLESTGYDRMLHLNLTVSSTS
ncbi:DNase I-like protein [Cubamyces sp. BRFM 1775]|nr:DNase I-like protein [Cubamyces sp. BRFM 1775]